MSLVDEVACRLKGTKPAAGAACTPPSPLPRRAAAAPTTPPPHSGSGSGQGTGTAGCTRRVGGGSKAKQMNGQDEGEEAGEWPVVDVDEVTGVMAWVPRE